MQTITPMTQTATPAKAAGQDPTKPVPEREGSDFDSVFQQEGKIARPMAKAKEAAVEPEQVDEMEGDTGDVLIAETDTPVPPEPPEFAAVEMPGRKPTHSVMASDPKLITELMKAEGKVATLPSVTMGLDAKTGAADGKATTALPHAKSVEIAPEPSQKNLVGDTSFDEADVPVKLNAAPRQPAHSQISNLFGLQLSRIGQGETAAVPIAMAPEQHHAQPVKSAVETEQFVKPLLPEAGSQPELAKAIRSFENPAAPHKNEGRQEVRAARNLETPAGEAKLQSNQGVTQNKAAANTQNLAATANSSAEVSPAIAEDAARVPFEISAELHADQRVSVSQQRFDSALSRPEVARHIGTQLVEVLPRAVDRPVELALSPEELGKVRISLNATDSGITMSVTAERQETLDLMRRHIDQLAQEFKALGYGSINFDFNQQNGAGEGNDQSETGADASVDKDLIQNENPVGADVIPRLRHVSDGLDLRV